MEDRGPAAAVAVRRATAADAGRLAELSRMLGYPLSSPTVALRLERLAARADHVVFVAVAESRVIGWIHGAEHELLESGSHCEILGLVVDPAHRSLGAGRRLVAEVEGWAARRGLDQMAVRSNVARAESHPFYERLGFVRAKTQHAYRKAVSPSREAAALRSFR